MSNAGRGARRRPASAPHPAIAPGATDLAPRSASLAFAASVASGTTTGAVVALLLAFGWGERSTGGTGAFMALEGALIGMLAGVLWGAVSAVLAAWAAMALHAQLVRGGGRARLMALGLTVLLWALGTGVAEHSPLGVEGLMTVGLPGLAVALAVVWWRMPWVLRADGR